MFLAVCVSRYVFVRLVYVPHSFRCCKGVTFHYSASVLLLLSFHVLKLILGNPILSFDLYFSVYIPLSDSCFTFQYATRGFFHFIYLSGFLWISLHLVLYIWHTFSKPPHICLTNCIPAQFFIIHHLSFLPNCHIFGFLLVACRVRLLEISSIWQCYVDCAEHKACCLRRSDI
jgi:hypothetical protein